MSGNFDKIDAFLNGTLPESELGAFEAEMSVNKELRKEVELHRLEREAIQLIREDELRSKLGSWQKDKSANKVNRTNDLQSTDPIESLKSPGRVSNLYRKWAIAASILILIAFSGYFLLVQKHSPQALFASLADTPSLSSRLKSGNPQDGQIDKTLQEAVAAFDAQSYDRAIELLSSVASEDPIFQKAQIGLAHAYFMKGKASNNSPALEQASDHYQRLLSQDLDSFARDEIEWYVLLSRLRTAPSDPQNRLELLAISQDPNHRFHAKAKTWLNARSNFWYQLLN